MVDYFFYFTLFILPQRTVGNHEVNDWDVALKDARSAASTSLLVCSITVMSPWPEAARSTRMILFKDWTCVTNPACPLAEFSHWGSYYHSCRSSWGLTLPSRLMNGGRTAFGVTPWISTREWMSVFLVCCCRLKQQLKLTHTNSGSSFFHRRRPISFWLANFENANQRWRQTLILYLRATHRSSKMQINSRAHHLPSLSAAHAVHDVFH